MANILIVGCGYVGYRVAALEQTKGNKVTGLVRSEVSAIRIAENSISPLIADLDMRDSLALLQFEFDVIYYFAPPGAGTDDRMGNFLSVLSNENQPERIILISTTGVYGDCGGAWISEKTPVHPLAARAKRRLQVEIELQKWASVHTAGVVILRVPGIYGPGKLPEQKLRRGEPVLQEQDSPYSNRIHVDDLARACMAAARYNKKDAIFNISDGHPGTMTDYFFRVADALKIPRPPTLSIEQAQSQLSAGILSYLAESKRLDNRKMREELGVEPMYPDLESGLHACIDGS